MIPLAHPAGAGGVPVPGNGPERPVVAHHQRAARPHAPHIPQNLPNPAPRRPGRQPSPQATLPYVSRRPHSLPHSCVGRARNPETCLLYTSDAADDLLCVDLGGRRIIKKKKKNKKKNR